MNIKKMFTTLSAMVVACAMLLPNASVLAASYSQELQDAYNWAYSKGVTTMSPIDNANMYGAITRSEMAKMLSVYATEVLGMTPDTTAACTFSDIASVKGDLHDYIIESCQLGIMGQGISAFRPYDTISRAEFGTALSRVLWGSQYEGGTPYYAKHLDALKAAGIMTQISNAESTKEIRGYVMLMLMRSEGNDAVVDCDDPMTVIACTTNTDACPAACKEADNSDTVVKAGDLAVSATAATDRKILVGTKGGVSDTDTLTFKSSEEVTISKVTLEKYGFSDGDILSGVRLEDADGNVITESKQLNNKDQVTLTIKKDYRNVDGTLRATVVVESKNNTDDAAGGTMGFKVIDVQSTAENLNLDNYKPYTYDLVVYNGTQVDVSRLGNDKDYNYEAGEMYEVARFRVKANNSAVLINGFTLTNNADKKVDLQKNLDKVEVLANGEKVSAKFSTNKDDQLIISLGEEYELAAKAAVSFVINASLTDFEDYGYGVQLAMSSNDLKAIEKKTETRVTVNVDGTWATHLFRGSKVKMTDADLKDAEAALGSVSVVVAEGDITVGEAIKLKDFTVTTERKAIEAMTLIVAGEEYDGTAVEGGFKFSKVVLEKSGKVQFKVDLKELEEGVNDTIKEVTFQIGSKGSFDKAVFTDAEYEELKNETVEQKDVSGSVKFVTLKVQAPKASLENNMSKNTDIEYIADKGGRKVVFDGTYTAKKGDITLNEFWIEGSSSLDAHGLVTFYVYVDGTEVGSADTFKNGKTAVETFSNVKVKKDQSVKVKVEAEVSNDAADFTPYPTKAIYELYLNGEDADQNPAGQGSDTMAPITVKASGSVIISSSEGSNTVKLRARGETIAYFVVKPADGAEGIYLNDLTLEIDGEVATTSSSTSTQENVAQSACEGTWEQTAEAIPAKGTCTTPAAEQGADPTVVENVAQSACAEGSTWEQTAGAVPAKGTCTVTTTTEGTRNLKPSDIKVNIGDDKNIDPKSENEFVYQPKTKLDKEGVVVEVILKEEATGPYEVTAKVNADGSTYSATKAFNREFVDALVRVTKQENKGSYTKYTLSLKKYKDSVEVTDFWMEDKDDNVLPTIKATVSNGDTVSADNGETSRSIVRICYTIDDNDKCFDKQSYEDFFVDDELEDLRVFKSN